jgi:membrane protein DedA with SNARE-associated domain
LFAYTGGFIWSVTFVSVGYFLGSQWTLVFGTVHSNLVISSAVIVTLFLLYILVQQYWRKRK